MASYIKIPEPCHEDWNNMLAEEQGRHCLKCCKTVIDFTSWETADIAAHLKVNAKNGVCGRLHSTQLNTPIEETPHLYLKQIYFADVSIFKKIAAIVLLAFGLSAASCNTDIMGKAAKEKVTTVVDTIRPIEMGEIKKKPKPDTMTIKPLPKKHHKKRMLETIEILPDPVSGGAMVIIETPPVEAEKNL